MKKLFFIFFLNIFLLAEIVSFPKKYYEIKNIKKMKQYFFSYLAPLANKENQKVLDEREFVIKNFNLFLKGDKKIVVKFENIIKKYKIKNKKDLNEYLKKIDIVPVSLILAQAAIESGWGKSRFVIEANNLFGHWTWTHKGIVPKKRDKGKKHKIRIFNSLDESIRFYIYNLNIGWAYEKFRELRALLRKHNTKPNGILLLRGLEKYSANKIYDKIVLKMIIKNRLFIYDN